MASSLWIAGEAASAAVVGLMLYRRLWRHFPLFLSYVTWVFIGGLMAYGVLRFDRSLYALAYLVLSVIDSVLLLGVLVELAWSILRPLRASLSRTALVPVIGVVLAAGAAVWPFGSLTFAGTTRQTQLMVHLQQTVSILQIIFLLVLIGSSQLLSIGWRDRELQMATGLGLFSFVAIGVAALQRYQASFAQYWNLNLIEVGAFVCCMIYWSLSFAQKEAERREFTPQMQSFLLSAAGAAHSTRVALTDKPSKQKKS